MSVPQIAICYFGITRSLSHTIKSIERNVVAPAKRHGRVKRYAHLFRQTEIINARSGESGTVDPMEYKRLNCDWSHLEEPDQCLDIHDFEHFKQYGDVWEDKFRSLRNLVHQLHSLDQVTKAALADGAETVIFCRPDLRYLDSLSHPLQKAINDAAVGVHLPSWQSWYGLNDRFAICTGRKAIEAYGCRIRLAREFCETRVQPLHAEMLLESSLESNKISVHKIPNRAARVRIDGTVASGDAFQHPLRKAVKRFSDFTGMTPTIRTILRRT